MARDEYLGRTAEVYFDSVDQKEKFIDLSKKKGVTFSKYILNALESMDHIRPDPSASEEVNSLRAENTALRKALAANSAEVNRLSSELQTLKDAAILAPVSDVVLDDRLIEIIQAGPIQSPKLLEALRIDPSDPRAIRALTTQLFELERMGFIAKGGNGWKWQKPE